MRSGRAQGTILITDPDAPVVECDTFTCGHCCQIVAVDPRQDPTTYGGWCGGCGKLICPRCEAEKVRTLKCVPLEARLAQAEARAITRRSLDHALA